MAEKTVATPETRQPATTENTRNNERYIAPPVDIYETEEGLVVVADVPGVSQEALDVGVDNHILTIRGHVRHAMVGERLHREYELVNFFRQFALNERVDQQHITAELKGGVLTLHLPKAEEVKPRRVAVRSA